MPCYVNTQHSQMSEHRQRQWMMPISVSGRIHVIIRVHNMFYIHIHIHGQNSRKQIYRFYLFMSWTTYVIKLNPVQRSGICPNFGALIQFNIIPYPYIVLGRNKEQASISFAVHNTELEVIVELEIHPDNHHGSFAIPFILMQWPWHRSELNERVLCYCCHTIISQKLNENLLKKKHREPRFVFSWCQPNNREMRFKRNVNSLNASSINEKRWENHRCYLFYL